MTTNIDLPTGTVNIRRFKEHLPFRELKIPRRIVLAVEGDAKPIHTALEYNAELPSWTAPRARFAEPPEHRGPFLFFTHNISRAREHLDIIDELQPFKAGPISSVRLIIASERTPNLDELWFTSQGQDPAHALIICGENALELRAKLKPAADAHLFRNKQIALMGSFEPKETGALREMLLDVGALMVWTPENRVSPEAVKKLFNYLQKVNTASAQHPIRSLDEFIERALGLWYSDAPDDPDLVDLLHASRWA